MRFFIEYTSIDMWEIIENGDYIPTIEQPVPQMVADPDQPPLVMVELSRETNGLTSIKLEFK